MAENKVNPFQQVLGGGAAEGQAEPLLPPYARAPGAASPEDDPLTTGVQPSLGATLLGNGFHPVLIFGTRATGKTTFLTSMLSFFTSMPDVGVTVTLGDQLSQTDVGTLAHEAGEKLFHDQVPDYLSGIAPAVTQDAFPFFVPLELRKAGAPAITKIALMESSGELWKAEAYKNNILRVRGEILDIYRNYPAELTVLIVVPYAMSEAYTGQDTNEKDMDLFLRSDRSLHQTLQAYQRTRPPGHKDQFYFVLTKWDMHFKPHQIASTEFVCPDESLVSSLIKDRFPRSFAFFRSMSSEHKSRYTVFSAGLIGGARVLQVPVELMPILQEFPYRLWQWIYANATGGEELYDAPVRPSGGRIRRFFKDLFS